MIRHGLPNIQPAKTLSRAISTLASIAEQADIIASKRQITHPSSARYCLKTAPAEASMPPCNAADRTVQSGVGSGWGRNDTLSVSANHRRWV